MMWCARGAWWVGGGTEAYCRLLTITTAVDAAYGTSAYTLCDVWYLVLILRIHGVSLSKHMYIRHEIFRIELGVGLPE